MRRVTGRSIGTFFREEVAGPLGADFHIGRRAPNPSSSPAAGWAARSPSSISRRKLTVSYAMNTMGSGLVGDLRGAMIVLSAYQALAAQS